MLRPDLERYPARERAAGNQPVSSWLADLADNASTGALLLSEVVDLLHRLVGEGVMKALIDDIWQIAFPQIFEGRAQPS